MNLLLIQLFPRCLNILSFLKTIINRFVQCYGIALVSEELTDTTVEDEDG
ncbi:9533_t:CDS:2 [Cetraspora pellucida]|uniref:9533_t:CDS:1 n=1 Tax=Cetraspora pellucida TaxID=1433469 RepID=A0ACA9K6Y2_9GLOM|nr:9533_t:CDS:2 [Cetraspora pellucida]